MITVQSLTKQYGAKLGVEDISFSIQKGEIVGLLGPNGAGKSTIMKMLAGHIRPSSGQIEVDGIRADERPREVAARIGFAPELPALYPEMPVKDFLRFITEIRGVPRPRRAEQVEEIMKLSGVEQVAGRLIKNLSKGYRQRVGLAQALVGFPPILILDELTAGMDPKQIADVRLLIKKLSDKHTIILSSHILSEIQATCEKVIILNKGRLAAVSDMKLLNQSGGEGDSFLLRLKAPKTMGEKLLAGVEGIQSIRLVPDSREESTSFFITGAGGVREEIFGALARQNVPILELRTASATLEEVFLQLTGEPQNEEGKK